MSSWRCSTRLSSSASGPVEVLELDVGGAVGVRLGARCGRAPAGAGGAYRISGCRARPALIAQQASSASRSAASRDRVDRIVLVADELDGPRRAAGLQGERRRTRRRGRAAARTPCRSRAACAMSLSDAVTVALAERPGHPMGRRTPGPCAQSWSRRREEQLAVVDARAARRWATTSRPWRWSARCIDANKASCGRRARPRSSSRSSALDACPARGAAPGGCGRPTSRSRSYPEQEAPGSCRGSGRGSGRRARKTNARKMNGMIAA